MIDDNFPFQTALVTGGGGFVGSHLVEELLQLQVNVICIDHFKAGKMENLEAFKNEPRLRIVEADITDFDAIVDQFAGVEVVFHQAVSKNTVSMKDPRLDLKTNAQGTFNVLEASRIHGVKKMVHASTGSVYGEPIYYPEDEAHPTNPVSFYGTSKLAAEKYCQVFRNLYGINATILRYFHVYGPRQAYHDDGGVVPIFIRRILENESPIIYGDGQQIRSFTYVKDVVRANLLVASHSNTNGQIYNCASGIKISIQQVAERLLEKLQRKDLNIYYQGWKPGDIKYFDIDNSEIKSVGMDFAWDFASGIDSTVSWFENKLS